MLNKIGTSSPCMLQPPVYTAQDNIVPERCTDIQNIIFPARVSYTVKCGYEAEEKFRTL